MACVLLASAEAFPTRVRAGTHAEAWADRVTMLVTHRFGQTGESIMYTPPHTPFGMTTKNGESVMVRISPQTRATLKHLKLVPAESYDSVIRRLFVAVKA